MSAVKAFFLVVVGAVVVAAGLFTFVPSTRPGFVQAWFRKARGLTPARTPTEAVDRFREAIKMRDYESAALYCDDDYAEQMRKAARGAEKLGKAIDSLTHNLESTGVNSDRVRAILRVLEPFPRGVKIHDLKESNGKATAVLVEEDRAATGQLPSTFVTDHARMINAFLPAVPWNGRVELVRKGEGDNAQWKITIIVTTRLRDSVDALKANATNYANALQQVSNNLKRDADTKAGVERDLERALSESKP